MSPRSISLTGKSRTRSSKTYIITAAFFSLLAIVGFALYGLPFFYDFFVQEFGWSRTVVTSGNAIGKLIVAPLFGFIAGWLIDRYGPKKMMLAGSLMAGSALIGLSMMNSLYMFYLFYILNALGYVFGGPLPCQVLISKWFTKNRGKAMGIAYLGIGTGGALVPLDFCGTRKKHWMASCPDITGSFCDHPFISSCFFHKGTTHKQLESKVQSRTESSNHEHIEKPELLSAGNWKYVFDRSCRRR